MTAASSRSLVWLSLALGASFWGCSSSGSDGAASAQGGTGASGTGASGNASGASAQGAGGSSAQAGQSGATAGNSGANAGSSSLGVAGSGQAGGSSAAAGTGSGTSGSSGAGGTVSAGGSPGTTSSCGSANTSVHPFGCKFGWGIADPGGSLASYSYLQLVSYWVDSSISAAGTYTTCNGCKWLQNSVAPTNLVPAYYAYIIGFLAHSNGIVDGNQTGSKKLTTDGAALIKANRQAIIDAYAWYAKQTYAVWPTKPLVWLLEGDFVQFTDAGQSSPLTMTELAQLASDITCAIKGNMPNAVVAIDQSSWNSDDVTNSYWGALKNVNYDLVWTTGVGNNNGFLDGAANSTTYNAKTAKYSYLHQLTGRSILVDTSAGASAAGDSWSTASVSDLNARISEGVLAANISGTAPNGLSGNLAKLGGLNALPSCQ